MEKYYESYKDYLSGKISEKEWMEICIHMLEELLKQNKEVFLRLK